MPTVRLRKRLLDRLLQTANSAGELGLALLMTAGVVHCGGSTQTGTGEGTGDAAADHGLAVEAAIEAAGGDGGPTYEAATFPHDAGSDAHVSPLPEAPPPPHDAGADAHQPVVEAATLLDGGADAHINPMVEAPVHL
jgi:hypothetical protein